ncbi:MAG: hypothetical protein NTY47_08285, partial [Candidatus Omnitrophica bacterium]|nr:hypothetical protein [Candidatus Omnitrophota bacterium]
IGITNLTLMDTSVLGCSEDGYNLVLLGGEIEELRGVLQDAGIQPEHIELFIYRVLASDSDERAGKRFGMSKAWAGRIISNKILPVLRAYVAGGGNGVVSQIVRQYDKGNRPRCNLDIVELVQTEAGLVCQLRDHSRSC